MKYQTVRQNVFETNSSSTHSATICVRTGTKPDMKPFSPDGKLTVKPYMPDGTDETWRAKMGLLGYYLALMGRTEELPRIENIISEFSGVEIRYDQAEVNKIDKIEKPSYDNEDEDYDEAEEEYYEALKDEFGYFGGSEYGDSVEDVEKSIKTILSDDDTVLAFVCSGGWFDTEHYYDG